MEPMMWLGSDGNFYPEDVYAVGIASRLGCSIELALEYLNDLKKGMVFPK